MSLGITKEELLSFQNKWGDALINVGKQFIEKKDYKQAATDLVEQLYGYNESTVLFKPTRAQHVQFRLNARSAVSYFVGEDLKYNEDTGFALQPWIKVKFVTRGIILRGDTAIAMGNYYFTDIEGKDKQVEYTMGVFRATDGNLRINLHHSSLPYLHPKHNK